MTNSRQIERTAAGWLAHRDAGSWSLADQARLTAWLEQSLAHRIAYLRLQSAWQQAGRLQALGAGQSGGDVPARGRWTTSSFAEPRAVQVRRPASPRRRGGNMRRAARAWRHVRYMAIAAIVLLAASTMGWQHYTATQGTTWHTPVGSLQVVSLADGSTATLSSNSRVHVTMSRRTRAIDLQQGEAFFEVARDLGRPFVVNAGNRRVTAVGTAFAVRRDDSDLRVIVTHGIVRLQALSGPAGAQQPTTMLPAGSVALADATGVLVRSGSVQQARDFLSWRDGYLSFHDTPLATAAQEFNRYNTRKIIIADPAVGALRVGGNFRWSNTDTFVRLLEQGFPIHVVRRDDTLVLQSR